MKKFLSMAALVVMGAIMTGCTSDDSIIDEPQQPANKSNVVTLTTTVSMDGGAQTRALAADGTKTFAVGDKIAVVYENTSDATVKVESAALTAGDIASDGKTATFTVTLTAPKPSGSVKYVYPAAMAGSTDVDYTKLASQDGTLASLAANLDLAVFDGSLTADATLPASPTLTNRLAILALTLKNYNGTSDLTSTITGATVSDGTNSYAVTRTAAAGPIYVAVKPTASATIEVTATDGTTNYKKFLTDKTYAANNGYNVSWKMQKLVDLSTQGSDYTVADGDMLTGTLAETHYVLINKTGASITLYNVNINMGSRGYTGIKITAQTAMITLLGNNNVIGGSNYPGISVSQNYTLTIEGSGSLTASTVSGSWAAGIGAGYAGSCGNIIINGGTITATGGRGSAGIGAAYSESCGNITINGGTITATGGDGYATLDGAPGIGGCNKSCGNITITGGSVTATKGGKGDGPSAATYCIGAGNGGTCGTITIGSMQYYDGTNFLNDGATYLATSPLTWPAP